MIAARCLTSGCDAYATENDSSVEHCWEWARSHSRLFGHDVQIANEEES